MPGRENNNKTPPVVREVEALVDKAGEASTTSARALKRLKRFLVALIGSTVLLIGVAMIVLPGPALIVIPAGLAILATEFLWARRALRRCQGIVKRVQRKPWFRRFRRRKKSG